MHLENIKMAKCKGDKDKLENIYMEVRRVYQQCHKVYIINAILTIFLRA
jgi:hypothetical protein